MKPKAAASGGRAVTGRAMVPAAPSSSQSRAVAAQRKVGLSPSERPGQRLPQGNIKPAGVVQRSPFTYQGKVLETTKFTPQGTDDTEGLQDMLADMTLAGDTPAIQSLEAALKLDLSGKVASSQDWAATHGAAANLLLAQIDSCKQAIFRNSKSQFSQPQKAVNPHHSKLCSLYAGLSALDLSQGSSFDMEKAQQAIVANQERDGGNPNAFYKSYGCAASLIYDPKPSSIKKIEKAVARKLPITIAVSWVFTPNAKEKAPKKGNHWLYVVGISGKSLFAKDQQNGHMMVTVNMDDWTGTAPGKSGVWTYTVTAVHIGCPTKEDWAAIYN